MHHSRDRLALDVVARQFAYYHTRHPGEGYLDVACLSRRLPRAECESYDAEHRNAATEARQTHVRADEVPK